MSTPFSAADKGRLLHLLVLERMGELEAAEVAELDGLRARAAELPDADAFIGEALAAMHYAPGAPGMPAPVRDAVAARGRAVVSPPVAGRISLSASRQRGGHRVWPLAAACLLGAVLCGVAAIAVVQSRNRAVREANAALAQAKEDASRSELRTAETARKLSEANARVQENAQFLTDARAELAKLKDEGMRLATRATDAEQKLAGKAAEALALAERLAAATSSLDEAQARIAKYEAPVDPATLNQFRTKLLEVPGTVRMAWTPFDLPNAPAELQGVTGDVVWNDERQEGYMRFAGLKVNDPAVEQYQVWVIDERGMEQKVSGGVFNASLDGEIVVPIHPGIEVGRVALFAVTVEKKGGTWVPDLKRRVVVAPRG